MRKSFFCLVSILMVASCGPRPEFPVYPEATSPVYGDGTIAVEPLITKATDSEFEEGDMIGLSVTNDEGVYAENALLTYKGEAFSGELKWYMDEEKPSELFAYYPYMSGGIRDGFSVAQDQTAGIADYDLMFATKSNVRPGNNAVSMVFKHQMTKVTVYTANLSQQHIASVSLSGLVTKVILDETGRGVVPDPDAEMLSVKTCNVRTDTVWTSIIVPQKASMQLEVLMEDGTLLKKQLAEFTLAGGTHYTVSAVVNSDLKIITYGQILPWLEGGDIPGLDDGGSSPGPGPDPGPGPTPDPEDPSGDGEYEGYIIYGGERYNTVTLKDGRVWMAENLRYVPEGKTVTPLGNPIGEGNTGIYYPAVFSVEDGVAAVAPSSDPEVIKSQGLLYTQDIIMNGVEMPQEEFADASEIRGICPEGWHIPTGQEWIDLVGHCSSTKLNNTSAPYYNDAQKGAPLSSLNEDGFNMYPYPDITNGSYNAKLMNTTKSDPYYGYCSLGYFASSTSHIGSSLMSFAAMITNNVQFQRVQLAYCNLPNGISVRCIKDKE